MALTDAILHKLLRRDGLGKAAADEIMSRLGSGGSSAVGSYLAMTGDSSIWTTPGGSLSLLHWVSGNIDEQDGSGLVLESNGHITVVEKSLVTVSLQFGVGGAGGTVDTANLTDTATSTWGPTATFDVAQAYHSIFSAYVFPASDQIWVNVSSTRTSPVLASTRLWVTAIPVA